MQAADEAAGRLRAVKLGIAGWAARQASDFGAWRRRFVENLPRLLVRMAGFAILVGACVQFFRGQPLSLVGVPLGRALLLWPTDRKGHTVDVIRDLLTLLRQWRPADPDHRSPPQLPAQASGRGPKPDG